MATSSQEEDKSGGRGRVRPAIAAILVLLTAFSLIATLVAYWNRNVVLDTDAWMEVVEPVLVSQEFAEELSTTLADGVLELVGLEALLDRAIDQIPDLGPATQRLIDLLGIPSLPEMADRLVDGVRVRLESTIDDLLQSEVVQASVTALVRRSHQAFVALATGDADRYGALYVDGDTLRLNTLPLLVEVTERVIEEGIVGRDIDLQLPDLSDYPLASAAIALIANSVDFQIPDDLGQVDVMSVEQLETLQSAARTLNRLVWLLTATTMILMAASLYVSPRPRRTLVQLSVALLIALIVSYMVIEALIARVREWFYDPTAAVFDQLANEISGSIAGVWIAVAVLGVLVGATAFLAGRPEWTSRRGVGESGPKPG